MNCYKQRLFLSILGLDYGAITMEFFPAMEHKSEAFLEINPLDRWTDRVKRIDGFVPMPGIFPAAPARS